MSSSESYFYNVKFIFSPLWMCLLFFGQVSAAERKISQLSYDPLTSEMNMKLPSEGSSEYVDDDYIDDGPNMTTTYREYYSNYVDLYDRNNVSEIISGHNHGNRTEDETFSSVSIDITDTAKGLQGLNGSVQSPYLTIDSTSPKGTTVPTLLISTDSDKGKEGGQNGATSGTNGLSTLSSIGGTGYFSGRLGRNGSLVIPTIKFTSGPFKRTEGSQEGETPSALPVTQPLTISPVINLYPMLSPFVSPCSCTSPYSWANPFSSMGPYPWANPCPTPSQYPWASQYQCHFHNHMNQLPPQYPYPCSQTNVVPMPLQFQNTPGPMKPFPSVVNPGSPPMNPVPSVELLRSVHVMPPIPRSQNSISYQLIT